MIKQILSVVAIVVQSEIEMSIVKTDNVTQYRLEDYIIHEASANFTMRIAYCRSENRWYIKGIPC